MISYANVVNISIESDIGVDLMCELLEERTATGTNFNIQCKGSNRIKRNSISIKVPTLNYWLICKAPVFIIWVDIENEKFYWAYPYNQVKDRINELQEQKTVDIKFSKENSFSKRDKELPHEIKQIIENFDSGEISLQVNKINHGAIEVMNIYELHRMLRKLKKQEKKC